MSNFLRANNVSLPECQTGVLEELERDEIENSGDFLESDSNDGSIRLSIHTLAEQCDDNLLDNSDDA